MVPFKLLPAFKDYIWGGTKLRTEFGKRSELARLAESWELSCHKDGCSVVADGPLRGLSLPEALERLGPAALGTHCARFAQFPILIKLIDAQDNLSVQVHPDNEYALRAEGEYGKTEMWVILEAEPGSTLLYGFSHPISREEFAARIRDNTLLDVLNQVPVRKGDVLFIDAGTLHAIGKGIVIAEIQQNSNTTYRIYDYGRLGADGKPRPLHIEKALDVTRREPPARGLTPQGEPRRESGCVRTLLAACDYFTVHSLSVEKEAGFCADETSFHSLLCTAGEGVLRWEGGILAFGKGESLFVPASLGKYTVEGRCELLHTVV